MKRVAAKPSKRWFFVALTPRAALTMPKGRYVYGIEYSMATLTKPKVLSHSLTFAARRLSADTPTKAAEDPACTISATVSCFNGKRRDESYKKKANYGINRHGKARF
jgi:hypothetical protein